MGRKPYFLVGLFAFLCVGLYCACLRPGKPPVSQDSSGPPDAMLGGCGACDFSNRVPVALNRGPEVLDGFRGEVHPVLRGRGELAVTANWNTNRNQDKAFLWSAPPEIRGRFLGFEPAVPTKTYTDRDFSRFLPAKEFGAVGQTWALDLDTVAEFLKQFHPNPSMRLVAKGRRGGPDGAFAVLRAVSPSHLDILFRAHAEFDVRPTNGPAGDESWFSPACFLGRLVVNREAGTIEYFWLGLPPDNAHDVHNVHITHANSTGEVHGWMYVERMELAGGDRERGGRVRWVDQIETGDAYDRLAKVFFKFKEIDWVPFDKVQEVARARKKPMLVVVPLGALDNQTC